MNRLPLDLKTLTESKFLRRQDKGGTLVLAWSPSETCETIG